MKSEDERKWFDFHGIQPELAELYRYFDRTVLCYRIIIAVLLGIIAILMSMIDAYNKAISEKSNDVDYFADAYMKILGTMLGNDEVKHIRDNRIINFDGDANQLIVEFLNKPDGDG